MGITKGGGFPYPISFNPIGYKTSGNPLAPLKKCGMIQYSKGSTNGVLIDKVGKSTRDAVQGRTLVGNGQTYVDTGIVPNQNTVLRVWGNFNSLTSPSTVQLMGSRTGANDYFFGTQSAQWRFDWGSFASLVGTADTSKHVFELNNGEFFIDGVKVLGTIGEPLGVFTESLFLLAFNTGVASDSCNFNLDRCEIEHDGVTYTLNIEERQSTGILSFNGSDGTKKLLQQYISPATATVVNNTVESAYDRLGGSIAKALGKNKYNKENDTLNYRLDATTGTLVSNTGGRTSGYIYIDSLSNIFVNANNYTYYRICYYDATKTYISGSQLTNPTTVPVNAKFFRFSNVGASFEVETQAENNTVATSYEPYLGYTMDQAGTIYFEDGTPIPCGPDGLVMGYVNGVRVAPEYSGRVRYNRRVVDGVVENSKSVENVGNASITNDGLTITSAGVGSVKFGSYIHAMKASTNYTIVLDVKTNTTADRLYRDFTNSALDSAAEIVAAGQTGIIKVNRVTKSDLTNKGFILNWNASAIGEVIEFNSPIVVIEDPTGYYLTNPLPTSGAIVPGNSVILADNYNGITKYDTNRIQTETDGTGKVLPIADMLHITNNQMFATEDKKNIGFFDKELTGDCKNKAITFFKQGEQLTDQNGDLLFDAQGNALYTFKPWVTN